jgi:hypothetical protein
MSGNLGDPMPPWKLAPNRVVGPAGQKEIFELPIALGVPYMEELAAIASDIFI